MALLGIGYVAEMVGLSAARAQRESPIISPRARAGTPPARSPSSTRFKLAPTCSRSSPDAMRLVKVPTIEDGAGKKRASRIRIRTSASHSAMSSNGEAIAINCSPTATLRTKEGAAARGMTRSDEWDMRGDLLRLCLEHLFAKQPPELVNQPPVRRVGPHLIGLAGPGKRDLHDGLDPSWCGRHDENAIGEHDGLVDTVGDEDHRLAALVPDLDELCLQQHARLLIEFTKRFVHEQDFGICRERARHADPFLHPSGELKWICTREPGQPDFLKVCGDRARDGGPRHPPDRQAVADILLHGHPRKDRIFLKHHRR